MKKRIYTHVSDRALRGMWNLYGEDRVRAYLSPITLRHVAVVSS